MAMQTTSFRKTVEDRLPYIEEIVWNTAETWEEIYSQVTNVGTSDSIKSQDLMMAPFGLFDPKPQGTDLTMDDLVESYQKDIVQGTWAKGFECTKELMRFGMDSVLNERGVALSTSGISTVEQIVHNECFSNGFAVSTSADGAFIYATHTLTRGGTIANNTSGDISLGALEDALTHFASILDEAGKKVRMVPRKLLVGPAMEGEARRLLNSMLLPGGNRNDVNDYVRSRNLELVVTPYLSSTTMWFVIADPGTIKAKVKWGWRPEVESDVDFMSKSGVTSMDFSIGVGVSDWRGLYGSSGS